MMLRLLKPLFDIARLLLRKSASAEQKTLLIQPLPGIGDMVWHLPHIHSIAAISPDQKVSILTKPRSRADKLLAGDASVKNILWLERKPGRHDGVAGFFRLAHELRQHNFHNAWILHDSNRYAWACFFAGIPITRGYGQGIQCLLLSHPVTLETHEQRRHPTEMGDVLLEHYQIPRIEKEGRLPVSSEALNRITADYQDLPKPILAIGLGSSELHKQWGSNNFSELACFLAKEKQFSLLLVGGPAEQDMADLIIQSVEQQNDAIYAAIGLPIDDTTAILSLCQLYIGNDTGFLNMAAALNVPAIGLFGASPPLEYSSFIHNLLPPSGQTGMESITVNHVCDAIHHHAENPDH